MMKINDFYLFNCHCMCSCSTNISPYKNFIKIYGQNSKRCSNYYFFIFEENYYFFLRNILSFCSQLQFIFHHCIHYLAPLIFDFVLYFKALGHYCTKTMNDVPGFLYPCVPCVLGTFFIFMYKCCISLCIEIIFHPKSGRNKIIAL